MKRASSVEFLFELYSNNHHIIHVGVVLECVRELGVLRKVCDSQFAARTVFRFLTRSIR